MTKTHSKSVRKFLRLQKAYIRRTVENAEEVKKKIEELVAGLQKKRAAA